MFIGWSNKVVVVVLSSLISVSVVIAQESAGKDYASTHIGALRYIPAGAFQRDDDPKNIGRVGDFRMGEKEITREQFNSITGIPENGVFFAHIKDGPVNTVSWYKAIVFCNKLSLLEKLEPVYTISGSTDPKDWGTIPGDADDKWDVVSVKWEADGYRLPTEMEWMWAAMGAIKGLGNHDGAVFTDGYKKEFAGDPNPSVEGDNPAEYAWYDLNNDKQWTFTVGTTKKANELGLYDMSGNVYEWCWDRFGPYPQGDISSISTAGRGVESGVLRVARGGCGVDVKLNIATRSSFNPPSGWNPSRGWKFLGFRVVRK